MFLTLHHRDLQILVRLQQIIVLVTFQNGSGFPFNDGMQFLKWICYQLTWTK
jgi:hypothetical protein